MRGLGAVRAELTGVGLVVGLLVGVLAGACRDTSAADSGCRTDADCAESFGLGTAADWRCEERTGVCMCRNDSACPARQYCNTAGFCQDRTGCAQNSDCLGVGLFCDTGTGTCLPEGRCTKDLHCRVGEVCNTGQGLCVEGCRTAGDCGGSSCRCEGRACACTAQTEAELAACEIGVCDSTFCQDETFCAFGQKCEVAPDAGTDLPVCTSDYDAQRRPYCKPCTSGTGGDEQCGRGGNFCLIDTVNVGSFYCGVDCTDGQSCPRGYACRDVREFPANETCGADRACPDKARPDSGRACASNADCPGAECNTATGLCRGTCVEREGASVGVCGCVTDSDCFQNTCSAGKCSRTGKPCTADDDCFPVRCVDVGGYGACIVGRNCAPDNGLTCVDVR